MPTKVHLVKAIVLPVVMYGCERWTIKKAECQRIAAFELWCWRRLLRVPWTARRSNQSILKEIPSWIFIGRTDAEAEAPILWPPDTKNWLTGKCPDAGKDWRQEEKGKTEDEMVEWHHWLDRPEFEQALGVGDGQGRRACCRQGVWTRLSDRTEWCSLKHYSWRRGSSLNARHQRNGWSRCNIIHIYVEYYSAIMKNEIVPFAATGMWPEIIILSETDREGKIPHVITCAATCYTWNLKHGTNECSLWNRNTDPRHREQACGLQGGGGGRGKDWSLELSETPTYRMDEQQGSAAGEGNHSRHPVIN